MEQKNYDNTVSTTSLPFIEATVESVPGSKTKVITLDGKKVDIDSIKKYGGNTYATLINDQNGPNNQHAYLDPETGEWSLIDAIFPHFSSYPQINTIEFYGSKILYKNTLKDFPENRSTLKKNDGSVMIQQQYFSDGSFVAFTGDDDSLFYQFYDQEGNPIDKEGKIPFDKKNGNNYGNWLFSSNGDIFPNVGRQNVKIDKGTMYTNIPENAKPDTTMKNHNTSEVIKIPGFKEIAGSINIKNGFAYKCDRNELLYANINSDTNDCTKFTIPKINDATWDDVYNNVSFAPDGSFLLFGFYPSKKTWHLITSDGKIIEVKGILIPEGSPEGSKVSQFSYDGNTVQFEYEVLGGNARATITLDDLEYKPQSEAERLHNDLTEERQKNEKLQQELEEMKKDLEKAQAKERSESEENTKFRADYLDLTNSNREISTELKDVKEKHSALQMKAKDFANNILDYVKMTLGGIKRNDKELPNFDE